MSLLITGIIDGPLSGGVPKALEIYVTEDIADLSLFGIGSANNGGASDGADYTFPADAVAAGTYIYASFENDGFTSYFGFAPDYIAGSALQINGDDVVELFMGDTVIDVFGVLGTDGTGEPWEHLDGWAYRNDEAEATTTFNPDDWTFSGTNALDGESSNEAAETPFPSASYDPAVEAPAATDLLISEIVEGSSFNKAIELFNGTGADIDLSDYEIQIFFNGNTTVGNTITLSGTIANGDTFVIADDGADAALLALADLAATGNFFNGDDAIVLSKSGVVVDSFGTVGVDPGSEWPNGGQNDTLIRKSSVTEGDTDTTDAFDAADEWVASAQDDFSNLGQHSFDGGTGSDTPTLTLAIDETAISENGGTATGTLTRTGDTTAELVVTLSSSDTTEATVPATATFAAGSATATFAITAVDDAIADGTQTVDITANADGFTAVSESIDITNDDFSLTKIHDIQGTAGTADGSLIGTDDKSPLLGELVTIEGIVTADFQDGSLGTLGDYNGFFVQEEEVDYDLNDLTSEGIFIFDGSNPAVDVKAGDLVRVTGYVNEYFGMTQLSGVTVEYVSGDNVLPAAAEIEFPTATLQYTDDGAYVANLEAYEGMLITIPQEMITTEMFNLDRYGEYRIAAERFEQFTQSNDPDAAGYDQHLQDLAKSTVTIDDGLSYENPNPVAAIDGNDGELKVGDTFGMGDTLTNVTGVLNYSFDAWRVQNPTGDYEDTTVLPTSPEAIGGNFKVVSMNVLNYFTTIDESGVTTDNGQDPRGADTPEELERQATKIVQAILETDANIYGLVEIENDFAGEDFAIKDLVERLNDAVGAELYAFVDPGQEFVGGDAIANALIYRTDRVATLGEMAILEEFNGQDFIDPLDAGRPLNRAAIAQTFVDLGSGQTMTVSVNHLKSKGSLSGLPEDNAQGDGAGNNNATREAAAVILADWLASDPTGQGSDNVLILGDLNSYAQEDPIKALEALGYTDLGGEADPDAYSYVFDGQIGTLDYAMSNEELTEKFAGATEWHINANEADLFDYDLSFNDPSFFDETTAARYSDHDPIIVGFDLYNEDYDISRSDLHRGTALNDKMEALADGTKLIGYAGNDLLIGSDADDSLFGGENDDIIRDGDGDDLIKGDAGDDLIIWQGGAFDRARGGLGADTFSLENTVPSNGKVDMLKVYDYEVGVDIIDMGDVQIANVLERDWKVELTLKGDGDIMTFNGVTSIEDLTFANDYVVPDFSLNLLHFADQEAASAAVVDAPNFSAVLNALRNEDVDADGVLTLSSGDAFIPGVFYSASANVYGAGGIADILIQNELGVQAVALGNHEFDFGTAELAGLISGDAADGFDGTAFPYLSTNLDVSTDANLAPLEVAGGQAPMANAVTSSTVIEEGGELFGIVGATTPTLGSISSPGDVTISPLWAETNPTSAELDALAAEIQAEVDQLLADNPAMNKVVLLAHMQQISIEQELAARLTDVDIIVAGGSNTRLFDENDVPRDGDSVQGEYPIFIENAGGTTTAVVNTDGSYKYVGRLVIDFDKDGNIIADSYNADVSGAYATDAAGVAALDAEGLIDPEIQEIADAIFDEILATEGNVFGVSNVFLNGNRSGVYEASDVDGVRTQETNLGNLTADANLDYANTLWGDGDDVMLSIKNGGGIRASIGETVVPAGGTEAIRTVNEAIYDADGNEVKPLGGISQNDIQTTLAFNNDLVVGYLSGQDIVDLLEHGVSAMTDASGRFPQISGVEFSYDPDAAVGSRVDDAAFVDEDGNILAVLVNDGVAVNPDAEYGVVTLGFLAQPRYDADGSFIGGGDGYPFPEDFEFEALLDEGVQTGGATFADDGTEQDALAEYLLANHATAETAYDMADTSYEEDARIINLDFQSGAALDAAVDAFVFI